MALAFTNLTNDSTTTDATSFETASISPAAGSLVIVETMGVSTDNVSPTISGASTTWTSKIKAGGAATAVTARVLEVFTGIAAGTGALTIDWGSNTQARCFWSITEVPTGSDSIVQTSSSERIAGGGALTTYTETLGAFSDVNNATYGAFHFSNASAITPGTGFTELSYNSENLQATQDQYKLTNDTSVDWSFTSQDADALACAMEIEESPSTGGGNPMFFSTGGVAVG